MQIKCRPNELEVTFICRFRSDNATLSLEEIVGEDIFIITEWADARGETLYYYKGFDSAEKAYREKREELLKDEEKMV